ncbi:MAG: hypothetical protein QNJ45_28905 [Ardenticatenaceae bacterium]|nr:hypothetical protein [Ardenticatenaceae bacterium]
MPSHNQKHFPQRTNLRLSNWDYRHPGAYFVTVKTYLNKPIFGRIVDGQMVLNNLGKIVVDRWGEIPDHFDFVSLDEFQCLPDHVHMILWLGESEWSRLFSNEENNHLQFMVDDVDADQSGLPNVPAGSLGTVVRSFKSAVTRSINRINQTEGEKIWHYRYHDRVIRSEEELERIRKYIRHNSLKH